MKTDIVTTVVCYEIESLNKYIFICIFYHIVLEYKIRKLHYSMAIINTTFRQKIFKILPLPLFHMSILISATLAGVRVGVPVKSGVVVQV